MSNVNATPGVQVSSPSSSSSGGGSAGAAVAGRVWELASAPVTTAAYRGLVYAPELGRWLALGSAGASRVAVSDDDGITWSAIASAVMNASSWNDICWIPGAGAGVGRFVAVSYGGTNRVAYSDDGGATWIAVVPPQVSAWACICYSAEQDRVVAGSYDGAKRAMYSDDQGLTWTLSATTLAVVAGAVAYSPELDLYVAVSDNGAVAPYGMKSVDGDTWTAFAVAVGGQYNDVCWAPGMGPAGVDVFVAVIYFGPGSVIAYSVDGSTWVGATPGVAGVGAKGIAYSPDYALLVAVNSTGALQSQSSKECTTWTAYGTPSQTGVNGWLRVKYGNGVFIASSISGPGPNPYTVFMRSGQPIA